jgi:hypothetical protein
MDEESQDILGSIKTVLSFSQGEDKITLKDY